MALSLSLKTFPTNHLILSYHLAKAMQCRTVHILKFDGISWLSTIMLFKTEYLNVGGSMPLYMLILPDGFSSRDDVLTGT